MSIEVLFNAEPLDPSVGGAFKELAQARLAFDKKGRCIKDNHTNIISRQQHIEGLLDSARFELQSLLAVAPVKSQVEELITKIDAALSE